MGKISILVGLGILVFSFAAWSEPCPDELKQDPFADQDWDGLVNEDDQCCYTANLAIGGGALANCGSSDPLADDNGNTVSRKDEGQCCVKSNWECTKKAEVNACPDGSAEVACDKLLEYGEEPGRFECVDSECYCFTVEDFDHDDSGPFDNCPLSQMSVPDGQETFDDGDIWGEECDPCDDGADPDSTGTYGEYCYEGMTCGPRARCVPFVTVEFGMTRVTHRCSSPPDPDADGFVQSCDNCPDVWNKSQDDEDGDGWGDECDGCPEHQDSEAWDADGDGIWEACDECDNFDQAILDTDAIEDQDQDGIPDDCDGCPEHPDSDIVDDDYDGVWNACDNCPGVWNQNQADRDGDEIGDACDMCPGQDDDAPITGEDRDSDGIHDDCDFCPGRLDFEVVDEVVDQDSDGVHDECDVCRGYDNHQLPFEVGVATEFLPDEDGDGVADICDACLFKHDYKATIDMPDVDSDGVPNHCDMCPDMQNTKAAMGVDDDGDGVADFCDDLVDIDTSESPRDSDDSIDSDDVDKWLLGDLDDDGVINAEDNCPEEFNPDQYDYDDDGAGDACSPFDDYSGAFTCRCNSVGANSPAPGSALATLLNLFI